MFQIQSEKWPGLAKFVEESSELNVNIAKLIATEGNPEYWGGVDLKKEIEDELADVFAVYLFIIANNNLDEERMTVRTWEKLQKYAEWRNNKEG